MTARRAPDFDLLRALGDPGFTPRVADVPRLLAMLAGREEPAEAVERALVRAGLPAARQAAALAEAAEAPARAVLTRLAGKVAAAVEDAALVAFLVGRLDDADPRTRRVAAVALGKVQGPAVAHALGDALRRERSAPARAAIAEALGKVGGATALAELGDAAGEAPAGDVAGDATDGPAGAGPRTTAEGGATERATDARFERTRAKASMIAARTVGRAVPSAIDASRPAAAPTPVWLRCRAGLERLLVDELPRELAPAPSGGPGAPGGTRVEVMLGGPLVRLFDARTLLSFAFPLPPRPLAASPEGPAGAAARAEALAVAVAGALTSDEARRVFEQWTAGPVRYRLAWAAGGKRRAVVWRVAELVAARRPELVNDPTQSPWEAIVHETGAEILVELAPRVDDPRFTYRCGDVPAASHPTIAAALVRIGGHLPDDVVWDPFVGSGIELCERSLLGPYRRLVGSDLEPRALAVARANLAAAGAEAELLEGDARTLVPRGAAPTLIVTNPPLGRRVQRSTDLAPMLDRFVEHAAQVLAPGGRMVWVSPFPVRTATVAARAGLAVAFSQEVDLGGFAAQIQAFRKRAARA